MLRAWLNGDDLMYDIVDERGRVICKTNTEQEAKDIIKQLNRSK